MRRAFIRELADLAANDSRILLLTGDLGYTVIEPFAERFPERFFNVGVAEQNLVGLATGLAEAGLIPFVYSIATFATLRPFEFIRNGPVLHRLPVRIVGIGGGFEYGPAGPTHHALEDVGAMRLQPGLTIISPADSQQAVAALREVSIVPGPVYFRLGKDEESRVPGLDGRFRLGRTEQLMAGSDLLFLAYGPVIGEVTAAAELLAQRGFCCRVDAVACLSPVPTDDLLAALAEFRQVITVEAHSVVGGLGSLVSELVAEHGLGCRVSRCGVAAADGGRSGSESFMAERHGLTRNALLETALGLIGVTAH